MTGEYLIWGLIIVSSIILIVFAILIWVSDSRMYCPCCKRFVRYIKWRSSDEPNFRGVNHGGSMEEGNVLDVGINPMIILISLRIKIVIYGKG